MKLTDVFPCRRQPFENIFIPIPNNYDFYLRGYGDYWQIPSDIDNSRHMYYYEPHIGELKEYLLRKGAYLNE